MRETASWTTAALAVLVLCAGDPGQARDKKPCGRAVPVLLVATGSTEGPFPFCRITVTRSSREHDWGGAEDWYTVTVAAADGDADTEVHSVGGPMDIRVIPTLRDGEAFLYTRTVLGDGTAPPLSWLTIFRYADGLLDEVGMLPLSGWNDASQPCTAPWSMDWTVGDMDNDGVAEVRTWFVAGASSADARAGVYEWSARKGSFLFREKPSGRSPGRSGSW